MTKWYQEPYFDKKNWLLSNFEKLNITNNELVVLLLLIYAKEAKIKADYNYFTNKLKCGTKDIDNIMASLVEKRYLKITTSQKGILFDISGIFEFDPNQYEMIKDEDIFDILTDLFKRPLSQNEMQQASDLIKKYGKGKFDDALRIAEAYNKISIPYITGILIKNENK